MRPLGLSGASASKARQQARKEEDSKHERSQLGGNNARRRIRHHRHDSRQYGQETENDHPSEHFNLSIPGRLTW
jgi:hypothetical protein